MRDMTKGEIDAEIAVLRGELEANLESAENVRDRIRQMERHYAELSGEQDTRVADQICGLLRLIGIPDASTYTCDGHRKMGPLGGRYSKITLMALDGMGDAHRIAINIYDLDRQ